MCTLGSVREEVIVGYGEPKRARNWKRSIQPRGYLRAYAGFLYSAINSARFAGFSSCLFHYSCEVSREFRLQYLECSRYKPPGFCDAIHGK